MSGVICAIRGGPASDLTIEKAIQVAEANGLPLYFLYVVNIDFLMSITHARVKTISNELYEMGAFILLAAQARAQARGVKAETTVRQGQVGEQIAELAREVAGDYIVLGRPMAASEENVFTHDVLHELGQRMEMETGAQVIFAEAGVE